ncbi:MAG: hypothetical protein HY962_06745 [Ignavibacteriae bacterium]|nr:hypothetical protein [Ignavibacteriota bacterium]
MGSFTSDGSVESIAKAVVENVQLRIPDLPRDRGVQASFAFLVALAVAARSDEPSDVHAWEIWLPKGGTPLELSLELRRWIQAQGGQGEYSELATQAATDALVDWYERNPSSQHDLFVNTPEPYQPWRGVRDGRGFSELAHAYFAAFTRRYLDYFLDREASAVIPTIGERERFNNGVALHSAETAKITQSFAAGWFNGRTKEGLPTLKEIQDFLGVAFRKIREELLRERDAV